MDVLPSQKKRLPFKPTALRKAPPNPTPSDDDKLSRDDDDLQLFRRSKEMAPIVAADRERRLRRRQRQEEERRRLSAGTKRPLGEGDEASGDDGAPDNKDGHEDQPRREADEALGADPATTDIAVEPTAEESFRDLVTPPPSKRSRLGSPSRESRIDSVDEAHQMPEDSPSTKLLRTHLESEPELAGPSRAQPRSVHASGAPIISLDSDDSDGDVQILATPSKPRAGSIDMLDETNSAAHAGDGGHDDDDDDDDEFAEYVRKAEEQRAIDEALAEMGPDGQRVKEKTEIIITSEVSGAKTCCMLFLFSRPLRLLRDSWVALQLRKGVHLSIEQNDDVILTWRRNKVYASSTLLNLGIRPGGNGRLTTLGHGQDGLVEGRTRVHMEAWTPELFRAMEHEEELRRKRHAGELSDDEDDRTSMEPSREPSPPEAKLRVILKARDHSDLKLTVRPDTTVETLITGFRTKMGIGADRDVSIWFDGERLEERVDMAEAEIDDMDTLEVHVK